MKVKDKDVMFANYCLKLMEFCNQKFSDSAGCEFRKGRFCLKTIKNAFMKTNIF
jgi:hypothetical protein